MVQTTIGKRYQYSLQRKKWPRPFLPWVTEKRVVQLSRGQLGPTRIRNSCSTLALGSIAGQ